MVDQFNEKGHNSLNNEGSRLTINMQQLFNIPQNSSAKIYLYVDEIFAYKTKPSGEGPNPIINIEIEM